MKRGGDCKNCEKLEHQAEVLRSIIQNGPHILSTRKVRKSIGVLERRANYLEARAAIRASEGKPACFDDVEVAALRWALLTIKLADASGKLDEDAVPDLDEAMIQSRIAAERFGKAAEASGGSK